MKHWTLGLLMAACVLAVGCKKQDKADGDDLAAQPPADDTAQAKPDEAKPDDSGMHTYVIERDIPGLAKMTPDQVKTGVAKSNEVIAKIGNDKIKWDHSYVTDDKMFCVYQAANEELLKEHAKESGFPATKISEVDMNLDPTLAGGTKNELDLKDGLNTYVIEREMPGAGKMDKGAAEAAAKASNEEIAKLGGDDLKWVTSFVTDDKVYCVYQAKNEDLIKKHAEALNMPATKILQVRGTVDPTTLQ